MSSHYRQLLNARLLFVKEHLIDSPDTQHSLIGMLERLTAKGMNTPESDDEDGPKTSLTPFEYVWMSQEVSILLKELDSMRMDVANASLTSSKTQRGNRTLPIKAQTPQIHRDADPTKQLPRNWYSQDWFNRRRPMEQRKLKAAGNERLPTIVSFLIIVCHL